jgi:predicted Zn-dependent protease
MTIRTLALLLLLLVPGLAGCTVNPATGNRSFTGFMGPEDEAELGREQNPAVIRAFGGVYGDKAVQDYVTRVGQALARTTELPELAFTFTVLDSPVINAFALPGGYVYVTRGLLALASDEAELAGVLAHEIGHVTARHAAQRYSQQIVAGLGAAVLGTVGAATDFGERATDTLAAVVQSYSRDQEFEADTLGIRYLGRAGYAVDAMAGFLTKLDRHSGLESELAGRTGQIGAFDVMATHPRTVERIERAAALGGGGLGSGGVAGSAAGRREQAAYLRAVDGLLYGEDPELGLIKGQSLVHPKLGIRFDVPQGFRLVSGARQITAQGPGGATIAFDTVRAESDGLAMDDYIRRIWGRTMQLSDAARLPLAGFDAAGATSRIQTRRGPLDLRLVAIAAGRTIHRFLFLTPPQMTASLSADLRRVPDSFRRLSAAEVAEAAPRRLRIHVVQAEDTREALIARTAADPVADRRFDLLNGLVDGALPPAGTPIKLIVE